tara:strand:+ start:621 stop:806 length:186 start_codon:yes stop_codon:yes gene_type:complete
MLLKESQMVVEHFIIFAFCVAGATYTAYTRGVTKGAETLLDLLEDQKIIKVAEDGSVEPYK